MNYSSQPIDVEQTAEFRKWLQRLKDSRARKAIGGRIARIQLGLLGDVKFFSGIGEIRIDYGPGYRLYFVERRKALVILLCGGDKSSQDRDIGRALAMAKEI